MDVIADLDTICVTLGGVIIATHVRAWGRHLVLTDPARVARTAVMRRDFRTQRVRRAEPLESVEVRDLAATTRSSELIWASSRT
ncbi:hypothetical protein OUO20_18095 [Arthrobacter sp. FX8]|nr:hypothetical protein [Arthrobacter sp. FX8]WAJ32949.1 hypothetical protein OUO20_18095 [Arthrobacter sp. FX8]